MMGGSKNMTRDNFVTPTNVSVTQDPLGNNLKKTTLGCNWVVHFKYYHYTILLYHMFITFKFFRWLYKNINV